MITGTVWGITLLLVGFMAALIGGQILFAALFADRVERARRALRARPVLAPAVGVAITSVVVVVAAVLGQAKGAGEALAAVLWLAASVVWILGLAVVSREVGERMPSAAAAPWRTLLRGGVTTGLAFLLPILGWIVILPVALGAGLGALVFSFGSARDGAGA